ncbi:PREDICTED: uncharacterized protein LOC105567664 isoform X2 [Vollenhovia emeryi]|uniref:uncharacterized protein LOC105567664 isoform X2 n=1 Tax=Vollenhovia emeryi TaxID=411798 RepID=UPI0005F55BF9|nr:PREDICTED: uncharacterized protein LOC105567664 isoform X2 [Vollenhovia emeryi]
MASDLSSGCTETIDILDDEKEEGEISLEDVSSSEEGGMGHLTSSYVVGRTRVCPDCKSWGECASWCHATYHPKSQSRRDPVKGKENRHHVREVGSAATKHALTLLEKNDDLVPISSDSDMEIVGLTDTSNRSKAKVKKKKRKKKDYEPLTIDELISPSSMDIPIADVDVLKIYRQVNAAHRSSGRSKVVPKSPIRRHRSPVATRLSIRSSRSPQNHSRVSPVQKRSLRKVRSPKHSPRRHSPARTAKKPSSKPSPPPPARAHVDRHVDVTRLLKKVKHLDSRGAHESEQSVNRGKESSLKEKLSNILRKAGSVEQQHVIHLKRKSKIIPTETIDDTDDEEDIALLRQKVLETQQKKSSRSSDHPVDVEDLEKKLAESNDDQDEEALQLRMIALRSAVMKKHQNRVRRGIRAKRSTRSESPFTTSFLDDIPVPDDKLLEYASPPRTLSSDSNHIEDMDLDTDVEREKEKLPYSPTDKITEDMPTDTALLGIEPSDVSFINVNERMDSPSVCDDAQDELATNFVKPYETYLPYQMTTAQYFAYSPLPYSSEIYSDFNDAAEKEPERPHGNGVSDLMDRICCQEGSYSSTNIAPGIPNNVLPLSPHGTLVSPVQTQRIAVEQPTNGDIVFVNMDSAFKNDKSAYEAQTVSGYSAADAPAATVYAAGYAEIVSPNESMITIDDLPENDGSADLLSSPNDALGDERNLPAVEEPLYMQGVPDITKDTNKIPTLINRTLVPAPILKSNKRLRQCLKKRDPEPAHPEPAFKSAEMQPVTVIVTDASSVFKPIRLQVAKKSAPVLSTPASFDSSTNEDTSEDPRDLFGENCEAAELEHPDSADTPSASGEAATQGKNGREGLDSVPLLENERSSCSDAGAKEDTNIASALDQQTTTESGRSDDNAQESSMRIGESSRPQSVTPDTQEFVNSGDVIRKRDMEKSNHEALSTLVQYSQEGHVESRCLSTNPTLDNSNSSVSDKDTKSDGSRRQSVDEDEDELRAILLASLKRTKTTDIGPSVTPIISVVNSAVTNVQTPALKTSTGAMPSTSSLPSKPITSSEVVKKKINNVPIPTQNGSRKRSGSADNLPKSVPKKAARKALTSTKVVNNAKKYQNMIVQRRLNLRKLDNNAPIAKPSASKISLHASDTQRFVISLGSDTDSESEGERNGPVALPVAEKPQEIPADFEKNLTKFLRDVRTEQEQTAAAKSHGSSTQATKQDVPHTDKGSSNMHTPLAVRHLPASQQEEYRRLKQEILEREKLKLQRKVASNNSSSSSSNKLSNLASSSVKSLPPCEKKAHIKQNQNKLKTPEKNSQEAEVGGNRKSVEVGRKSNLPRGTPELNVCRMSADKKLSANIAKHANLAHLQAKSSKKAIPNDLSIRISNVTVPSFNGGGRKTVENSLEKQPAKDKQQQHKPVLRALSTDEINRKCMQVLLKPDTIERVVIINDRSILRDDTMASVGQSDENLPEPDARAGITNEKDLNNIDDNNDSTFSNASTVLLHSSANVDQLDETMETTLTLSQYEAGRQRESNRDTSASVLAKSNDSNNGSHKSDAIAVDSLASLPEVEQERHLRETEHKLVAKRYMVLDHLAEMSGNLRQWDMEKDVQTTLANEVKKLKEQLKVAEEKLQEQRDRVSLMGPKVSTARQKINVGRRECDELSKICSTLGNRLLGKNYNAFQIMKIVLLGCQKQ